jgi:transcriptional regulator GlxA family with amidase domain
LWTLAVAHQNLYFAPWSDTHLPPDDADRPHRRTPQKGVPTIGVLLVPGFSLMSYAVTIEPLRAANSLSGRELYRWCNICLDGAAARASNGTMILADRRVGDDLELDMLLVCAGGNPTVFDDRPTFRWLRSLARRGVRIGGVSGGPYVLARAGLLSGHRFTVHWEHIPALVEEFPDLTVSDTLFEIDRDRLTCAGGIAALDMMHALIEADHGHRLASAVSDWFLHSQVRLGSGPQRMTLRERFGVTHPRLLRVLEHMEARIEEPASRAALAAVAGLSPRQLERLFQVHLGSTIGEHYLGVRLERAQTLLRQSTMPVLDVAVACGFVSASHFSRSYKQRFGCSPRGERAGRVAGGEPGRTTCRRSKARTSA